MIASIGTIGCDINGILFEYFSIHIHSRREPQQPDNNQEGTELITGGLETHGYFGEASFA